MTLLQMHWLYSTVSNGSTTVNGQLKELWTRADLSQHLPREAEENDEEPQSGWAVDGLRFEHGTSEYEAGVQ
jgi:hypothetical protein